MNYRHAFHAGNFADVHKHVTLLALIRALQHKDKGFFFLDTHAGAGLYDGAGADARHGAEARAGINLLLSPDGSPVMPASAQPEIQEYLEAVAAFRASAGSKSVYPGSPLIAAQALRPQDRGVCCEIVPPECRALERALKHFERMRAECGDGCAAISALFPPRERRALLLIDPPYENPRGDLDRALDAAAAALARLANTIVALWYPIKDARTLGDWQQRASALRAPSLVSELWVRPPDNSAGLNGSGLLILNPPWQFDTALGRWLPWLAGRLASAGQGGSSIRWIRHEDA
jgi:23S rRNA (adenine2030-N6)-methyltransferase